MKDLSERLNKVKETWMKTLQTMDETQHTDSLIRQAINHAEDTATINDIPGIHSDPLARQGLGRSAGNIHFSNAGPKSFMQDAMYAEPMWARAIEEGTHEIGPDEARYLQPPPKASTPEKKLGKQGLWRKVEGSLKHKIFINSMKIEKAIKRGAPLAEIEMLRREMYDSLRHEGRHKAINHQKGRNEKIAKRGGIDYIEDEVAVRLADEAYSDTPDSKIQARRSINRDTKGSKRTEAKIKRLLEMLEAFAIESSGDLN